MKMLTSATTLDWAGWLRGLAGAVISGGAGAVAASFSVTLMDPKDWSPTQGGSLKLLALMGICFTFSGIISLMKYLQTHPIPDDTGPVATVNVKSTATIAIKDDTKP